MIPCTVPVQLQNLTQLEEMLIARAFPVVQVFMKPKGGQRPYKGHLLTLPQDVQQLADILPRCPKETSCHNDSNVWKGISIKNVEDMSTCSI
eukprot:gene1069-406_t